MTDINVCALCDIERAGLTPYEAFALGMALERAVKSLDARTRNSASLMCTRHRLDMSRAMMTLAQKLNASVTEQ